MTATKPFDPWFKPSASSSLALNISGSSSIGPSSPWSGQTKPFTSWYRDEGFSRHKGARLLASGEVDSLNVMARRHVVWQSYLDYLERQRTGRQRDPVEKERAAREYRASAAQTLLRQGRNLVRGSAKGRPNRASQPESKENSRG
jgi:hypothetical protein